MNDCSNNNDSYPLDYGYPLLLINFTVYRIFNTNNSVKILISQAIMKRTKIIHTTDWNKLVDPNRLQDG